MTLGLGMLWACSLIFGSSWPDHVYVRITKTSQISLPLHYHDKIRNLPRETDLQICAQIVPNVFET